MEYELKSVTLSPFGALRIPLEMLSGFGQMQTFFSSFASQLEKVSVRCDDKSSSKFVFVKTIFSKMD